MLKLRCALWLNDELTLCALWLNDELTLFRGWDSEALEVDEMAYAKYAVCNLINVPINGRMHMREVEQHMQQWKQMKLPHTATTCWLLYYL